MDLGAQPVMLLLLLQGASTNHHYFTQKSPLVPEQLPINLF